MDLFAHFFMQALQYVAEIAIRADATVDATMSRTQLEREIEDKLRQVGIVVVPPPTPGPSNTHTLRLHMAVTPGENQSSLETWLKLTAWFVPICGPSQSSELPVWWGKRSQVVNNVGIDTCLRQDVDSLVDEFVAAYRAARQG